MRCCLRPLPKKSVQSVAKELQEIEGMTPDILASLAAKDIVTLDDLAELATDELAEIVGLDNEAASEMILRARAHWFDE